MAEIDSNFPFNQLGIPRVPQGGDEEAGALSNLRRVREEREEREEEAQRTRETDDRVNLAREGREGEAVPAAEQAVQREAQNANAPERVIEDPEAAADARTLSAIQQAVAAVVRQPEPLQPEEPEVQPNIVEPGVEGPVGQIQLQPEALPANLLTPAPFEQPPQPEAAEAAQGPNPPPAAGIPAPVPAPVPEPGEPSPPPAGNVEQLEQNRGALRQDFLGTDRELRSFITEPGNAEPEEPPPAGAEANRLLNAEREPFVPPGAQPETVAPSVAEALQAERVEEARAEQAEEALQAQRERREDEEEEPPPPPPNPEALVTERGFRINEII